MLSIFSCANWSSVCALWRNVYLGFLSIFSLGCLLLSCMSCLYILEVKSLSVASFANIFSQSVDCLFVLCMIFFAVQKLVSLIRSHLFILAFIFVALGGWTKKILLSFVWEYFTYILWYLVIYLCLWAILSLFLYKVWGCVLTLLIYMWLSSFHNTTCWRDCLFSIVYYLLCWRL